MICGVGDALPTYRVESISIEGMKRWSEILRDPNPIHLDAAAVKAKGWGDRVINQGPANLAYVITMLQRSFPGARLESLDARYVDNAFGGEAVEAGGTVKEMTRESSATRVTCEVWLRADARDLVITGTAALVFPE